ncbi:MAG: 4-(cytidine 5'-diphospho)-2-C-methyl-D-erythritol kinase [Bacteroidetes bacterium]|nr:4-(cytidine 5'-diphospho)-2-C-methyl-D-erythritol kinase [Bacteroidota bacterium]HET6244046.1 4-(cytidine 5'-diphospho)-2-C-methyl-D-erythritol kinase [Bacteroidia bacterium]
MIVYPNAKINIGLHVIEKRLDGFHTIETVFLPIGLSDILEVIINKASKEKHVEFSTSGIFIPGNPSENICVKIYEKLKINFNLPALKIHLHKIIPVGAGLGGGSSDAAFFIKIIDALCELNLDKEKKLYYSEQAGSDAPFFIENKISFAQGKGEKIFPLLIDLKGLYLVLINPKIHISTVDAYSGVTPKKPNISLKNLIVETPIENWKEVIRNDFEESIFKKYPQFQSLKQNLYLSGAVYAAMSGSGSSLYGFFREKPELNPELKKYVIWEETL